ncbi:MAG: ATP-dependent RecD-like DNA helicase [Clostridia bacterium]|nr:ATP-dependent RecD-like DNA helicase [Clostridia bacterium]
MQQPTPAPSLTLEGVVNKIIYRNEENSYVVMELICDEEPQVAVGYAASLSPGESVRLTGSYAQHQTYGRQFAAASIETIPPGDEKALLRYLQSGAIRGIGRSLAERMVKHFGMETLSVMEKEPNRLTEVKGITAARAHQLAQRYQQLLGAKQVMAELRAFDLPAYVAVKLYKQYGMACVEVLSRDPYLLCTEDYGLDFERVDHAAAELFSIRETAPVRVRAGVLHILRHNLGNGHTFLPIDALTTTAAAFLELDDALVREAIESLQAEDEVVVTGVANLEAVFLKRYYTAEAEIAARLMALSERRPCNRDLNKLVEEIEAAQGVQYAAMQKRAIRNCAENGVFILTGGPGTGKTTTLRGILAMLEQLGLECLLAAPTGRAAKRMSELSGATATTIHRMLGMSLRSGAPYARFHENNRLEADVIIVDEVSMLEVTLFDALLRAMKPEARLILVGDANQLPPVGAGNILRDLLGSDIFSSVELTEIFRQSRDSLIVVNAHSINKGEYPSFNDRDNDFFLVSCPDKAKAAETLAGLVARRLPKAYKVDPFDDIQVISPTRKGEAGTALFNARLQEALNPRASGKAEVKQGDKLFRVGDKVMQIHNNYELPVVLTDTGEVSQGLFNGDVGRILDIDRPGETMTIRFDDREVAYPFDCLHQLELAYAVTVHKSQGSEYPIVIMAAYTGMPRLQTRNLFYTAVTRARQIFIAFGEEQALLQMTDNSREDRRYSALKYLLLEYLERDEG